MEWIGPFFQDFEGYVRDKKNLLKLTNRDLLKANSILSKPYLRDTYLDT